MWYVKGQSHEIFNLWFFPSNNTPRSTYSWAKAVSNIESYLRRYSTTKLDSTLCCIARSNLYLRISLQICRGPKISRDCPFKYCILLDTYCTCNASNPLFSQRQIVLVVKHQQWIICISLLEKPTVA
jgi:hypothetical protein